MAITTINESDLIKDSRTVINSNFTELDTTKAPLNSPALTGTPTAPTPNPGDDSTKLATTEYVQEEIRTHANIPIGFEYFSMNPNIPDGSLPLLGGEYSRATYPDLWAWVQQQTGYLKTEAEWQALSTANNGNVPYYSSGDGSTTFRVPSLRCWVKGTDGSAQLVGSYLAAGLPNITGNLAFRPIIYENVLWANGAFSKTKGQGRDPGNVTGGGSEDRQDDVSLDASRSSSIYGNSSTVQPESIVGLWLVKAYGTVVDTGTIDEKQYIDDRIAVEVTRADSKYLPLTGGDITGVLSVNEKSAECIESSGTNYIRYVSGLQICFDTIQISMSGTESTGWSGTYYVYRKIGNRWNFPVSFVSPPVCVASVKDSGNYWSANAQGSEPTYAIISLLGHNNTDMKGVFVIAIGRWK